MESFELAILSNVAWGTVLALVALATVRILPHRPALTHTLWVLVLIRLITPPLLLVSPPVQTASFNAPAAPVPSSVVELPRDSIPAVEVAAPEPILLTPPSVQDTPRPGTERAPSSPTVLATGVSGPPVMAPATADSAGNIGSRPAPTFDASADLATRPSGTGTPLSSTNWTWRSILGAVWFLGAVTWGSAVVLSIFRLRHLLRSAHAASGDLVERTSQVAARLGLRRAPGVWMVPARIPPMLWSLGGPPRLLLPAELWDRLDGEQQETILAHELAHLRRRDHWVRWLEGVVLGLHWWNPLAWLARRQIEKAEEPCCDAWVVWALPEGVDAYAEALVATAAFLSGPRVPRPLGATGARRVTELRRRLTMILSDAAVGPITPARRSALKWAMPLCLVALLLLPVFAPGQPPESTDNEVAAGESPAVPPAQETAGDQPSPAVPGEELPTSDVSPTASPKPAAEEEIDQEKPHEKGKEYGTSSKIPRGMRVITITAATHGTEPTAGDRVEVFISFRIKGAMQTRVLLESVEVFATGPTTRENKAGEQGEGKTSTTVSLLVTRGQVPYIKLAEAKGTITLKVRPLNDEVVGAVDQDLVKQLENSEPVRGRENSNAIPGEGEPPGPEVKIQQPVVREMANTVDFVGRFEALERVELQARASGALLKVNAVSGAHVRRGDLLFEIDSRVYVAGLRKVEAELARLEAQLRRRALDLERAEKLAKAAAISQEEVARIQGDVDEARAAIGVAQPEIELARLKLEATRITAPIDGRFRLDRVRVSELVLEDKTLLGTIESIDPVTVRFAMDERTFHKMNRPAPTRVEVLEFGLEDAAPSRQTAPIVEKLASEGLPIRRVDGLKSPELATQFEINRYPTVVLLINGKEVERHSGMLSEERFRKLLAEPRADAPSGERGLLESGAEVLIGMISDTGYPIRGKLESVDTRINPETGTVECRVLAPNKEGVILPGMLARIRMVAGPPFRHLCVPAAAIVHRELVSNGRPYLHFFVRVVNDRGHIERREVVMGETLPDGDVVVISTNLKESDRVAVPTKATDAAPTY